MNETTKVGAGTKGKGLNNAAGEGGARAAGMGKSAGGAGNPKAEGQIGRMLVRAIWAQEWSLANPDGQGDQRKAAWKEVREAAMEKNLKTYRRALNSLSRSGVTMVLSESGDDDTDA